MTDFEQTLPILAQKKHEEELFNLRRQIRSQEAEWKKNKAVLEQRIEILELQNRELKEREDNLKKMNNSIFGALKDFNKENDPAHNKLLKEQETMKQQMSKDHAEYKIRNQEMMKQLEKENKELKEKLTDLESKHNQMTLHYEKNDAALQQRVQSLEDEKKNSNLLIKLYEDENKQYKEKEMNFQDYQTRITELQIEIEKQRESSKREMDRMFKEHTQRVHDLKSFQDSEKASLESQIHKLLDNKKLDGTLFQDCKRNYETQINILRKEKGGLSKKNDELENQVMHLTESVKALEFRLGEQKFDHEKEGKELKKVKLKIIDYEIQIKKLEQIEKGLRQTLSERDQKIDEVSAEFKRKLGNEKKRNEQAQELARKYKDEGEKKCSVTVQENIKKEEQIKKLQSQLATLKKEVKMKRMESDMNKTLTSSTSIVDVSLANKTILNSRFNGSRSYLHEVKGSKDMRNSRFGGQNKKSMAQLSRDFTMKTLEKDSIMNTNEDEREDDYEEDEEEIEHTNEDILVGFHSPRPMNSMISYRNHPSNKKDTELSITSLNKLHDKLQGSKKQIQPILKIDLMDVVCNFETENGRTTDEENNDYYAKKAGALVDGNYPSSVEIKKKGAHFSSSISAFNERKESQPLLGMSTLKQLECESSKGMLFMKDFVDEANLGSSVHDFNKDSFSLNPSMSQITKRLHDTFENAKTNMHYTNSISLDHDFSQNQKNSEDDRVNFLESRLREAETKSEKATLEKERLQVELDRLILELKQTKMEWALSEESKEESELGLKNEIKFLINKLLQVKENAIMASSSHSDLSQFTKSTLNKSTLDQNSTSFYNASGYLNSSQQHPTMNSMSFSSNYNNENLLKSGKNTLTEKKVSQSMEKKFFGAPQKPSSEKLILPLREKNRSSPVFENVRETSPKKENNHNEFRNNENSLLNSLLNMGSNTKRLMGSLKR